MKRWFVAQEGKLKGPYTVSELEAMVKAGTLKAADTVCPEGGGPTTANRVPHLFASAASTPPAPTAVMAGPPPVPIPPAAAWAPQYGTWIAVGFLGFVLLGCIPATGLGIAWYLSQDAKKLGDESAKGDKTSGAEDDDFPKNSGPKDAPPIDVKVPPKVVEVPMPPRTRAAIDNGIAHLRKRLKGSNPVDGIHRDDENIGVIALAGLALLEAKVPPDDPAIEHVLAVLRDHGPRLNFGYAQAACLFFLNRLDDFQPLKGTDRELARSLALRMLAGQKSDGRWSYGNQVITPQAEKDLLAKLSAKSYKPGAEGIGDNSQTQFALLALWGSRRHGLPVRPALLAAATRFHETQNPAGFWTYEGGDTNKFIDSNTCAGLIALAMEKTLREDKKFQGPDGDDLPADPQADAQRDKAFAHLAKVIGRSGAAAADGFAGHVIHANAYGDFYFLWCLERVGVIYDCKEIGGKDWYAWGSEIILQNQRPDGSWSDRHGDVCDTSFAILFLTRANLARDLTESIRTRGGIKISQ